MKQYKYEGPIMWFDRCVASNWSAVTYAATEAKARANLTYRAKQVLGKTANSRVTLPGKITVLS